MQRGKLNYRPFHIVRIIDICCRFHPCNYNTLYTAVNTVAPRAKKSKTAKKQAYILKWRVNLHEEKDSARSIFVERARKAGEGGLTCFDVRFVNIHLESTSRIHIINDFFPAPMGGSLLLVHLIIRWECWTVPLSV